MVFPPHHAEGGYYATLIKDIDELSTELHLNDHAAGTLRDFVLENAKTNYKQGNRAGIAYVLKNRALFQH